MGGLRLWLGMTEAPTRADLIAQFVGVDGTTGLFEHLLGLGRDGAVRRYRASVGCFDNRVFDLTDGQLDQAWVPDAGVGRWPIRALLGHLADAELVQSFRIRRAVAEPGSVTDGWDPDAWFDSGIYGTVGVAEGRAPVNGAPPPIGAFVAAVYTTRQWMGEWLGMLGEEAWGRSILHAKRGALSVRELVAMNTWHLEHHAWYLNAKVGRLLGEREGCEPASCENPACACKGAGA